MLTSEYLCKQYYSKYFTIVEIISYLLWVLSKKSLN